MKHKSAMRAHIISLLLAPETKQILLCAMCAHIIILLLAPETKQKGIKKYLAIARKKIHETQKDVLCALI